MNNRDKKEMGFALMAATKKGDREMIDRILGWGADINSTASGLSVLHVAVVNGDGEMLNWLLEHKGINANVKDKNGRSPLHFAFARGSAAMALDLVEKGGGLFEEDREKKMPLEYLAEREVVPFFRKMSLLRAARKKQSKALPSPRLMP